MEEASGNEQLEPLIFAIRGHRVVLDADLARLYGVSTKRFNEAFKRNRHRFPQDFAFELTIAEFNLLRARSVPGAGQVPDSAIEKLNRSQFATGSSLHRNVSKRLAEIDRTLLQHDAALRDVYQKLLPLLQPTPVPPKRRIGF